MGRKCRNPGVSSTQQLPRHLRKSNQSLQAKLRIYILNGGEHRPVRIQISPTCSHGGMVPHTLLRKYRTQNIYFLIAPSLLT